MIAIWSVPALRPDGGVLPDWLVGSLFLVGAIFVIPLFWPVLIAIALFEGSLAERIAVGDRGAAGTAARLVGGLGLAFVVIAAAAVVSVVFSDPWPARHEFVAWAWLGPAALGAAHLVLARSLSANANGKAPVRRLT